MVTEPETIEVAHEAGVNFFLLSADMHWPDYEATRRGLASLFRRGGGVRDEVVVAVVSYVAQPEFCHAPFQEVIDAVPGLGRIDLTVAGASSRSTFFAQATEYARHEGIGARAFGATFHDRAFAAYAVGRSLVDVGFVRYNPIHRGAERDVFPRVVARGPTLLYNFNSVRGRPSAEQYARLGLSGDHWRPGPTDYYRFALAQPELDGVLCALSTPAHVRSLAETMCGDVLTEEESRYLRQLADLSARGERIASAANSSIARKDPGATSFVDPARFAIDLRQR
jgi:hypothetical protein